MWRLIAAIVLLALAAVPAAAAPQRAVRIETQPSGAAVYLNDKDSGTVGATPLELALAPGEHTVILELAGYLPRFEVVKVEGGKQTANKAQVFSFTLEPAIAALLVTGANFPRGARVLIDGEERGAPPVRLEVEPGAHHVEVVADGVQTFDAWVELEGGAEKTVTATFKGGARPPPPAPASSSKPAAPATGPRQPYAAVGAGYDLSWRRFRYDDARTANAQPFDADAVGFVSVWAQLHPQRAWRAARPVWPLSLVAGYAYGLPLETALPGMRTIDAYWRTAHAGLRWRVALGPWAAVDLDAGWARNAFTFRDKQGAAVAEVPDVDYQSVRLGARGVAHLGPADLYAGAENQIVLDGGLLEDRFRAADANAYGLHAGLEIGWWRRRLVTRAEARWSHYGWVFGTQAGDEFQAAGASDDVYGVTFSAGVSY